MNANCTQQLPIQFQIGDGQPSTPINGTPLYSNSILLGKNFTFEKMGMGTLFEGIHYSKWYQGGVIFIDGALFSNGEFYTITIN